MPTSDIKFIDQESIEDKRILLRVDFDVSQKLDSSIADDYRITQNLPTMKYLLSKHNRLICVAKRGRPTGRDPKLSLKIVAERLQTYLPDNPIIFIDDFQSPEGQEMLKNQKTNEIILLENIRYYPEEKRNDLELAKKLASLADVYVNDAFAVCHRAHSSVVAVAELLPSYGGLLLKKEIEMIGNAIKNPQKPVVTILGGAKISTKINLINKLLEIADYLIIGGGLANTFLAAEGYEIGKSIYEYDEKENARRLLFMATQKNTSIVLPSDVVVGKPDDKIVCGITKKIENVQRDDQILDIGPETQAKFGAIIAKAKTIIWNGPVGYFENACYRNGTDFIYYSITHNDGAVSIVGGGDTLAAISKKEYLDKITHISTGGGAMLEYIEKGTLPGIEALRK
ncbi:MAG: phosphoglycerate kinase [bacterium]|nr:phosphoglycerate kinase [bacterium]